MMTYKRLKWLILTIPSITIGLWEYVRHEFLLEYISMDLGNWLAPLLVLIVSVSILSRLFVLIEKNQEELNRAKAKQVVVEERDKIARELHDGIAQSIFFLNAQITRIEKKELLDKAALDTLKKSVYRTNDYVRQAIANLRYTTDLYSVPWLQSVESLVDEIKQETEIEFHMRWNIKTESLNSKEKVELIAILREAIMNVYKHANATKVIIEAEHVDQGWICQVIDNGTGFPEAGMEQEKHYGIKMMQDRANAMQWDFSIQHHHDLTIVQVAKKENGSGRI